MWVFDSRYFAVFFSVMISNMNDRWKKFIIPWVECWNCRPWKKKFHWCFRAI